GGYVYRGPTVPELTGKYIYADYCTRTVWSLEFDGINPPDNQTLLTAPASVTSFGVDENNELYVVTFSPDRIYRFSPTVPLMAPTNLVATATGPNEVELGWDDNNTQEDGFKIERKTGLQGTYSLIDSVVENVISYLDQSVEVNTLYYYRVFAFIEQVVSDYSNEDSAKTPNPTGVEDSRIPNEYKLEQNYPNPFNPSTKINFSLAEISNVNIRIYNSLGKTIDTISGGVMQAGIYGRIWNAQSYASGIYYLKMTAESINSDKVYSNVIKMIYLK
ncbi:MAG: T9SS type A sorting domain-containing protein, partial [Bacteroidetes bacterium]|nr:T9SS type A sorting domain-containing protein [Bacteroidota bacterium]